MAPAIGIMIAAYIITRMLEMISGEVKTIVKVFCCATILVCLVSVVNIMNAGSQLARLN
jgi:hypothetical protein